MEWKISPAVAWLEAGIPEYTQTREEIDRAFNAHTADLVIQAQQVLRALYEERLDAATLNSPEYSEALREAAHYTFRNPAFTRLEVSE